MASPYNGLFVPPTPITGQQSTVKNADGTTINSGGPAGTLKTHDPSTVVAPASFTAPPAPTQPAGRKF